MDVTEEIYQLYCASFDRLADDIRRLDEEKPQLRTGPMRAKKMTRERFEQYLFNGRETDTKRLFLRRILRGNEHLHATLPAHLKSLAERAA